MRALNLTYPTVRRSDTTYRLHGKTIEEPYDYMEDPENVDTKAFVSLQNELFKSYINSETELCDIVKERLTSLFNYCRISTPLFMGKAYYYYYNSGLQNQDVLMRAENLHGPAEVFLDPNTLSNDGTTSLNDISFSKNEEIMSYSLCDKGSDWCRIYVRDVKSRKDTSDKIQWVKFSAMEWWGNEGFFYNRFPAHSEDTDKGTETNINMDPFLCFHRLGTTQEEDLVVFRMPENPLWSFSCCVSPCETYLILHIAKDDVPENLIWVAPLPSTVDGLSQPLNFNKIINEFIGHYTYLGNEGEVFYFSTTAGAKRTKVVSVSLTDGSERVLVEEQTCALSWVCLVRDTLLLCYMENAKDIIFYCTLQDNTLHRLDLPIGTVCSFFGERFKDFVSFKITSFVIPGRVFIMDINDPKGTLKLFRDITSNFNPDDFVAEQEFYNSFDGTRISMFLVHKKGELSDTSPVMLYGYGGFNISLTPAFSATNVIFLKNFGGVLAIPNIRGGGEYGEEWHDSGRRAKKQNCFSDFIAAAKYLHSKGIGSPATTVIKGVSNGGLLVAAAVNQAPQEFGCVICKVGVLDMFKFHKFTIGHAWKEDYGDPDKEEDFHVLEKYSPLHNIKPNTRYPPILVLTSDHDDRVVPLHSLKYIASLQHLNPSEGGPFLACIEVSAGHGTGKALNKVIQEEANMYVFISKSIGVKWRD